MYERRKFGSVIGEKPEPAEFREDGGRDAYLAGTLRAVGVGAVVNDEGMAPGKFFGQSCGRGMTLARGMPAR